MLSSFFIPVVAGSCLLAAAVGVSAEDAPAAKTELLWPEGAPGAKGDQAKDKPTLIIHLPAKDKANGTGIVVCPGGGYGGLAMDHEGVQIAAWLNSQGIACFICDYRHAGKGYSHPAPLNDAQRAIRIVKTRAKEFGIEADKVGILGFSAGGHLTSSVGTHFDAGDAASKDLIQQASSRPDFMILCYPVIAFDKPFTHRGSQKNLLGDNADPELVKSLSSELQVTDKTPPTFIWSTYEDTGVPPQNSIVFYEALLNAKVPSEIHVFEKGRHGVGLGKGIPGTEEWPNLCLAWMKGRGLLSSSK